MTDNELRSRMAGAIGSIADALAAVEHIDLTDNHILLQDSLGRHLDALEEANRQLIG